MIGEWLEFLPDIFKAAFFTEKVSNKGSENDLYLQENQKINQPGQF